MNEREVIDHFRYFSILTNHLDDIRLYIEIDERNMKTFSMELARLIILSGTELKTILTELYHLNHEEDGIEFDKMKEVVLAQFPLIETCEVTVDYTNICLCPWGTIDGENIPWIMAYDKVKNNRFAEIELANLENLLNTMSAHLVLLICLHHVVIDDKISAFLFSMVV